MKDALVIVDMQKEFYSLQPEIFDRKIIPNLKKLLKKYRKEKKEIIHIITQYKNDKSNWPETRKNEDTIWCLEGTESSEIIDGFTPQDEELTIIKTRFTAFYDTALNSILKNKDIRKISLAGYASDVCVRMTAVDAYNHGYEVCLYRDCMDSYYEEFENSIEYLKWLIRAEVK